MYWSDEAFLLSKNNFNENSLIIEIFTPNYGKCSGIVYGGLSRKQKKNFQIGNKLLVHSKSRNENSIGYFTVELINPISPPFFDDKRRSITILSASTLLKILLPERQINTKIYLSFENLLNNIGSNYWINMYIFWELSLIRELGFDINISNNIQVLKNKSLVKINEKLYKIPELILNENVKKNNNASIKEALYFNKNILIENFIEPNRLRFPYSRNILEKYFN
jgi:DNA repair protein RecO (recombination protein O)